MRYDQFGSGHDLDLRSNFIFYLLGHIIHHATPYHELNTMVVKSLAYLVGVQSYDRKSKSSNIGHFDIS